MKKNILFFIFLVLFVSTQPVKAFSFSLFENKYISEIKKGTFNFDTSLSIGNAFENYQYFNNTEWKYFETPQGRKVVEFNGYFDMTDEVINYFEYDRKNPNANSISSNLNYKNKRYAYEAIKICLSDVEKCPVNLHYCKYTVQFIMNRDGFNVGYIGYSLNGVDVRKSTFQSIKDIYNNKPFRDKRILADFILNNFDKFDEDLNDLAKRRLAE